MTVYKPWYLTKMLTNAITSANTSDKKISFKYMFGSNDIVDEKDYSGLTNDFIKTIKLDDIAKVSSNDVSDGVLTVVAVFTNENVTKDHRLNTIGIVAEYNGKEFLAAVSSANDPYLMTKFSDQERVEYTIRAQLGVSNTDVLNVKLDPVSLATNENLSKAINQEVDRSEKTYSKKTEVKQSFDDLKKVVDTKIDNNILNEKIKTLEFGENNLFPNARNFKDWYSTGSTKFIDGWDILENFKVEKIVGNWSSMALRRNKAPQLIPGNDYIISFWARADVEGDAQFIFVSPYVIGGLLKKDYHIYDYWTKFEIKFTAINPNYGLFEGGTTIETGNSDFNKLKAVYIGAPKLEENRLDNLKNNSLNTNEITVNKEIKTSVGVTGDSSKLADGIFEQRLAFGSRINRINWDGFRTDADLYVGGDLKGPRFDTISDQLNRSQKFMGDIPNGTDTEKLTKPGIYSIGWGSKDIKNLPIPQPCWGSYQVYNTGATYHLANLNDQMYYRAKSGSPEEWHDWVRIIREDDLVNLKNKSLETNDLTINNKVTTAVGPTGDKATLNSSIFEQKLNNGKRINRINWDGISTDADITFKGEIKGPTIYEIKQRLGRTQEFKGLIDDGTDVRNLTPGLYYIWWGSKDIKNLPIPQPCWGSYEVADVGSIIHNAHLNGQMYTCTYSGDPMNWSNWKRLAYEDDLSKSSLDRGWVQQLLWTNDVRDYIITYIKDGIIYLQGTINVNYGDTQVYKNAANIVQNGSPIKALENVNCDLQFTVTSFTDSGSSHNSRLRIKNGYLLADWLQTGTYDLGGIALPIA